MSTPATVIRQEAGSGSTQYGIVNGSIYNVYQTGAGTSDAPIDMRLYLQGLLSRPAFNQKFIPLDIEPSVCVAGRGFLSQIGPSTPLMAAIETHRCLLLLGNAGAGKSASLRHIAALLSRPAPRNDGHGGPLEGAKPLFVELSRFRAIPGMTPLTAILALIAELLHAALEVEQVPSERAVHKLLVGERLVLLLDGLNEVAQDSRPACVRGIQDLAAKYGGVRIVVGTRFYQAEELGDWPAFVLQELQGPQVLEFLGQHLGDGQAEQIAAQIIASNLALLRLPLFLKLVVDLAGASSGTRSFVNGSRSYLVARYARYLLSRDNVAGIQRGQGQQPSAAEAEVTLTTLADLGRRVGQSVPLVDASRVISEAGGLERQKVEQIVARLCQMGVLFKDGEYIRFWHQTLQDYYHSLHLYRLHLSGGRSGVSPALRNAIQTSKEDEGCAYLIAHVEADEVLQGLLGCAANTNAALCFAWIDDLRYESRAVDVVTATQERIRTRVLRGRRYSIITGRRSVMLRLAVYPFALLGPVLAAAVGVLDGASIVAGALLAAWLLVIVDVAASYGGIADLQELGLATIGVRHARTQQDIVRIGAELSSSALSSGPARWIGALIVGACGGGTGALDRVMATVPVYVGLPALAQLDDARVLGMLKKLTALNNSYSCEAVRCLGSRHERFPQEGQDILAIYRGVLADTRPRWKLWRLAREELVRHGEAPQGGSPAYAVRTGVLGVAGLLLGTAPPVVLLAAATALAYKLTGVPILLGLWRLVGSMALGAAVGSFVPFEIAHLPISLCFSALHPVQIVAALIAALCLPVVVWVDMNRMKAKGVPGCRDLAALPPWQLAVLALCWPGVIGCVYPVIRHVIRRNVAGVHWDTLVER